jgi:hypothetical protein
MGMLLKEVPISELLIKYHSGRKWSRPYVNGHEEWPHLLE